MRAALTFVVVVGIALVAGQTANPRAAEATHSLCWRYGACQWWVDLKPWGDGDISYLLCGLPYYLPAEWEQGVENWDASMAGSMDFDLASDNCSGIAETWLGWELGNECSPADYACWDRISWEEHGLWDELEWTVIFFDYGLYGSVSPAWQTTISAHEWGHNLNLEDHGAEDQCDVHLIMATANDHSQPPCLTGPSSEEALAVAVGAEYYGLLDTDGDGYEDGREVYHSTDYTDDCPDNVWDDAWPPDQNNDTKINLVDVLMYKPLMGLCEGDANFDPRFDLYINWCINLQDVLLYKQLMQEQCS